MPRSLTKSVLITLATASAIALPSTANAIEFNFNWMGQIAGFRVSGSFGYDQNQVFPGGIVTENDLDFLDISFFAPDGTLLRTYENNHLDPGVNFNFDTDTRTLLQAGSYNADDGINLGSPNFDFESGNDISDAEPFSLSFWSKPPRSSTPHLHVQNWPRDFGFPLGFSSHEDVGFPTLTTEELIARGQVGDAYLPGGDPGMPVTDLDETGQFAKVTPVPDPHVYKISLLVKSRWRFVFFN